MNKLQEKINLFSQNSFKFCFTMGVYYNCDLKKIFSTQAADRYSAEWLEEKIKAQNHNGWAFYFVKSPSIAVRKEILEWLEAV